MRFVERSGAAGYHARSIDLVCSRPQPNFHVPDKPEMPAKDNPTPLDEIPPASPARLQLRNITKTFGATKALEGVNLEISAGEVHAIIGENGAGKSTLMKVLSGACDPDDGEVILDGVPLHSSNPRQSLTRGIAMIYQELNLAPDLSVAENIVLGDAPRRWGWMINHGRQREIATAALNQLQCNDIDVDARVGTLSIAAQQMVEIARAVRSDNLKVLILDEPTSSLTRVDSEHLFQVIDRLRRRGVSIVYISHFLEECSRIADRFTVLRDGRSVGTGKLLKQGSAPESTDENNDGVPMAEIVQMMVGRDVSDLYPDWSHDLGEPILHTSIQGQTLTLHRGEILGLAGLIGAGRTEWVRGIFGLDSLPEGTVEVVSESNTRPARDRQPRSSWQHDAMGMVSEDRKNEGLLLDRSLTENLTLTRPQANRWGILNDGKLRESTESLMTRLRVKAASPDQAIGDLSGGNQQKIAVGRLLHHQCKILLLDEPTRGIDIGSKQTIYDVIGELAASGKAVLMVSSYLPELLGVCDTIAVMSRGRLMDVRPRDEWTEESLLSTAVGQTAAGSTSQAADDG